MRYMLAWPSAARWSEFEVITPKTKSDESNYNI